MSNVFVMGLEPFNLKLLEKLPQAADCRFLELLSADEAVEVEPGFSFKALLDQALERAEKNGPADGVINYWDFPGSSLAPLVCHKLGLPGPDLRAVAICEHKYWARKEMEDCIPDMTPKVCKVDPFADDPASQIDLKYPYWLKPFVSHSSYLGFKIESREDLDHAIPIIRDKIGHFGEPFNEFLEHVEMPEDLAGIGGCHCIAEAIISADHQVTLEGYVWQGKVHIAGCIDSIREGAANSSFSRYDYPSNLPAKVLRRMKEAAQKLMTHIGFDNGNFNIEFFWDEDSDRISVLEINSRLSKSHAPLFHLVDGQSHQAIAVDLALGREPRFQPGEGDFPMASKFMVRLFQDGEVTRVPHESEIHYLKARYPDTMMQVLVSEGQRLSHLSFQDSYSFEIADLFFGGEGPDEVQHKYSDAMEQLHFGIDLRAPEPEEEHRTGT